MRPHRRNTGQRVSLRSNVEIGKALLARARDFADGWRQPAADAVVEVLQRVTPSILTPVVVESFESTWAQHCTMVEVQCTQPELRLVI